jgi:glycine cleavage system H protein
MMIDPDARYLKTHEWAKKDGNLIAVGLTAYAIEQLGDIVYLELPEVGQTLKQGDMFGVVESVKSASDMYAPVSGTVVQANAAACDNPDSLKQDPYDAGWLIKIDPSDIAELDGLMDAEAYRKFLETEA